MRDDLETIVALLLSLFMVLVLGYALGQRDAAVCHAPTEDSAITDCYYKDGAWRKR